VLQRETVLRLNGQKLNIPAYCDIAIAISRRFMRGDSKFPKNKHQELAPDADDGEDDDEDDDPIRVARAMDQIADQQAGHSPHIAESIYARGIMEAQGVMASERERYRRSSTGWHMFLRFGSSELVAKMSNGMPWTPDMAEAKKRREERRWDLQQVSMEAKLQEMMNHDGLQFRGEQRPSVEAVQAGHSPVVAVMPTGSGKSMLFMLPAWVSPQGMTVVVVPFISAAGRYAGGAARTGRGQWRGREGGEPPLSGRVTPRQNLQAT
jgi:hypothetical protein